MRLIDADALKDNLRFSHGINDELIVHVPLYEVIRNIDNAPTVTFDDIVRCLVVWECQIRKMRKDTETEQVELDRLIGLLNTS